MTLVLGFLGCAGAALVHAGESTEAPSAPEGEGAEPVACLLPAEIDRLGQQLTILGARQRIETSRADCLARGGEVIGTRDTAPEPKESLR